MYLHVVCVCVRSQHWLDLGKQSVQYLTQIVQTKYQDLTREECFCRNAGKVVEYVLGDCSGCCEEEDLPKGFVEEHKSEIEI